MVWFTKLHYQRLPTTITLLFIIPQEEIAVRIHRVSDPTAKWF